MQKSKRCVTTSFILLLLTQKPVLLQASPNSLPTCTGATWLEFYATRCYSLDLKLMDSWVSIGGDVNSCHHDGTSRQRVSLRRQLCSLLVKTSDGASLQRLEATCTGLSLVATLTGIHFTVRPTIRSVVAHLTVHACGTTLVALSALSATYRYLHDKIFEQSLILRATVGPHAMKPRSPKIEVSFQFPPPSLKITHQFSTCNKFETPPDKDLSTEKSQKRKAETASSSVNKQSNMDSFARDYSSNPW